MSRLPEIANPQRPVYPSDLSDTEWKVLEPFLPKAKGFGRPRTVDLREILNAIFYVQRTGCQWEMLPHDLPPMAQFSSIFENGAAKGFGKISTIPCAINWDEKWAEKMTLALPSLILNR